MMWRWFHPQGISFQDTSPKRLACKEISVQCREMRCSNKLFFSIVTYLIFQAFIIQVISIPGFHLVWLDVVPSHMPTSWVGKWTVRNISINCGLVNWADHCGQVGVASSFTVHWEDLSICDKWIFRESILNIYFCNLFHLWMALCLKSILTISDMISQWQDMSHILMKFNKKRSLAPGEEKPQGYVVCAGPGMLEWSFAEEALGSWWTSNWT